MEPLPQWRTQVKTVDDRAKRWWRYAVIRGEGLPARLDGRWYDLEQMDARPHGQWGGLSLEATNQWEQRDDGAVAVVYRMAGISQICHLNLKGGVIACGANYSLLLSSNDMRAVNCLDCRAGRRSVGP